MVKFTQKIVIALVLLQMLAVVTLYISTSKRQEGLKILTKRKNVKEVIESEKTVSAGVKRRSSPKVKIKPARCDGCNKWMFREIMKPERDFCIRKKSDKLLLVIIVISKPQNRQYRLMLRKLYIKNPRTAKKVQMVFAFGNLSLESEEKLLQQEADKFGDILQFDFKDAYTNSSYTLLNSYKWLLKNCNNTQFVVKITDDMFLYLEGILKLLETNGELFQNVLFGYAWMSAERVTNKRSQYYTPPKFYPYPKYPPFVSGADIFAPITLLNVILTEASNFAFGFYHDDVSIGMVLKIAGKCVCNLPGFQHIRPERVRAMFPSRNVPNNTCSKLKGTILGIHLHHMVPEMLLEVNKCISNFRIPDVRMSKCFLKKTCPPDNNFPLYK